MSSSDLTSSDNAAESKEIGGKEDLDSIDASLDAILSEAKEVSAPSAEGSIPAEEADTVIPPPADIQISLSEGGTGTDVVSDSDGGETPLPVIVDDDEPSYKAFAEMVTSTEAPSVELPVLEASVSVAEPPIFAAEPSVSVAEVSAEPESGEILDADALIDSMTPAPEPAEIEAAVSLAKTEESQAFAAPPPSDEEILDNVKLPPGSTPMPLLAVTAPVPSEDIPGSALGDDDQTVISPMPPIPEPAALPPPPRFGSAWAMTPPAPDLTPSILLAREGMGTKIRRVAGSRVQTSVSLMAMVVIGSCALGAGVMRLASKSAPTQVAAIVVPAPAKAEPVIAPLPVTAAAAAEPAKPAATAKAEKSDKTEKAEKAEKVAAAKPAPAPAKAKPAPQATHIALAAPTTPKPAPAKRPAPAAKPKKASAQGGGNWVDPFGQ